MSEVKRSIGPICDFCKILVGWPGRALSTCSMLAILLLLLCILLLAILLDAELLLLLARSQCR